ncbi:MAG TPA: hypothetical protein VH598_01245 [Verrucomicrobiae bacterium]|nr:hypothetical protein [Verrucomicrobiae bacterium]
MNRSTNQLLSRRYVLAVALIFALVIGMLFFMPGRKAAPPLPFGTNLFIATAPPVAGFAPNASLGVRARYYLFKIYSKFQRRSFKIGWSFPASPVTGCSIQGLLNQCMQVSGTRYLMPVGVAAGVVQFGHTNVLDGPHWVAAFEQALQSDGVQCWDPQTKTTGPEHLVLLRFPAQKVVVVLPAKAAEEFQRTNGIHLPASGQ